MFRNENFKLNNVTNSNINTTQKHKIKGQKCIWFSINSASFRFIIIKINKNKTAIAPT